MQVTETLNDGLKREYSIFITADELNETVDQKLREAQPEPEVCKPTRKRKPAADSATNPSTPDFNF